MINNFYTRGYNNTDNLILYKPYSKYINLNFEYLSL